MKKIIIGVTASIAAYKACDLVRMFVKDGFDVHVVMTKNACELVAPLTFETLSGNPVMTDSFQRDARLMGHISLKEDAALLLVAPATANMIAKFASGIADDILSTTFLSVKCPVLVAPAMNPNMWSHPSVKRNISILSDWGVKFVSPSSGKVVCGDEGEGKLAQVEDIFSEAKRIIG